MMMIIVELVHVWYSWIKVHSKNRKMFIVDVHPHVIWKLTYLKSGLIEPNPSFNDETKCEECCKNNPSPWLNELLLIFGAEPALPLMKLSPCVINKFWCDEGLKLFDGILTGFELWSKPWRRRRRKENLRTWTVTHNWTYSPSEFVKGELGMFTGADCGWSILDEIPADIELSKSNCAAELNQLAMWFWLGSGNLLKPYKQRRFLRSFSIGLNNESFSIAKI